MNTLLLLALSIFPLIQAQNNPPPSPVVLTTTKSAVLPVLPPGFTGVDTLEGAIIKKAPANYSYVPVNGPAEVQSNLPAATYVATLPAIPFDGLTGTVITGTVTGSAKQGDTGVTWTLSVSGFPNLTAYGPFAYHIHDQPVPADGNCTSTLGHFDYTNAGEYYTCATNQTQMCQTGDLAGKHGAVNASSSNATYVDNYLSTDPSSPYFFGSKSIVFHTSNRTRLTCANFTMMTSSSPPSMTSSAPKPSYTGAATKTVVGNALGGLALLVALMV